ncbi:OsmC-related (seleno)protein [Meridianimarinicoccus sp. RP-17]|uniref:OsmC family protein n=1 Tax=Meridianimarinicoccus zhengii TaxID=2056810 RepID=UPI000DAC95C8|nr:OsmC family protein [Phycocomes zhengii]
MSKDKVFDVVFTSHGVCVGKMRNEVTNTAHQPFQVSRMLATDEGKFQGGEDTSPTPLEFFLTGLVGCLMTQIRVFGRRMKVEFDDLEVTCDARWVAHKGDIGPYEASPVGFDIGITMNSDAPEPDIHKLIEASRRACFVEATLAQANEITHSLRINAGEPQAV